MGFALPRNLWPQREPDFDPPGVVPAWLVRMADLTSWILIAALMYFLFLWTLEISGDRATPLLISKAGIWELNTAFYWPLLVGFLGSAIGLPLLAKIGIPIFCELSFKKPGQGWPKFWMLILIILTSLVIIAGNMHVINGARLEKNREGAVKVELNDQARGALQANLDAINQDLADITNPALTTYQAQASREGAAAWAKRVAIAKAQNDYQADAIARAQAAAERGDQLRADRKAAMLALASAPTQAAAAERIVTQGDWVTSLVDEIDRVRAVMLGAVQDLAALLLGWIAYRLAAVRKQQLADWEAVHATPHAEAGVDLHITDQTDSWQVQPQDIQYDEDGNELVKVRRKKEEYYRRKSVAKPKKKDDPRAAQMFDGLTEDGQNPQSEVSDERLVLDQEARRAGETFDSSSSSDVLSGDLAPSSEGGGASTQDSLSQENWTARGGLEDDGNEYAPEPIQLASVESDLTHAQEDQQADDPEQEAQADVGELPREDVGSGASDSFEPDALEQHEDEQAEAVDAAPFQDGTEDPIREELQDGELAEPENEDTGSAEVTIYTPEEIEELERQWAARKGLPAPSEAAE